GEQGEAREHHQQEHRHRQDDLQLAAQADERAAAERIRRAVGGHRRLPYQAASSLPANSATRPPSARKVPKGSRVRSPASPRQISAIPVTEPAREAKNSATSIPFQPRKAPIRAIILTSPR